MNRINIFGILVQIKEIIGSTDLWSRKTGTTLESVTNSKMSWLCGGLFFFFQRVTNYFKQRSNRSNRDLLNLLLHCARTPCEKAFSSKDQVNVGLQRCQLIWVFSDVALLYSPNNKPECASCKFFGMIKNLLQAMLRWVFRVKATST